MAESETKPKRADKAPPGAMLTSEGEAEAC
jgi:hypothetical protein